MTKYIPPEELVEDHVLVHPDKRTTDQLETDRDSLRNRQWDPADLIEAIKRDHTWLSDDSIEAEQWKQQILTVKRPLRTFDHLMRVMRSKSTRRARKQERKEAAAAAAAAANGVIEPEKINMKALRQKKKAAAGNIGARVATKPPAVETVGAGIRRVRQSQRIRELYGENKARRRRERKGGKGHAIFLVALAEIVDRNEGSDDDGTTEQAETFGAMRLEPAGNKEEWSFSDNRVTTGEEQKDHAAGSTWLGKYEVTRPISAKKLNGNCSKHSGVLTSAGLAMNDI